MSEDQNIPELFETFDSWFKISVKILKTKIAKLGIGATGELYNSLDYNIQNSGQSSGRGYLNYNLYGKFIDIGVGRGISRGNSGNLGFTPRKKRKEWYSRTFYAQVMRLREISATQAANKGVRLIVMQIEAVKDLKTGR